MGSFTPKIEKPKIEENPNLAAEQSQAQRSLISGLQTQSQMDTANIMARFGTINALGAAGIAAPATTPAPVV
jgi:hypothetical protein